MMEEFLAIGVKSGYEKKFAQTPRHAQARRN